MWKPRGGSRVASSGGSCATLDEDLSPGPRLQMGAMTPMGLLMGHAVYGVVLALMYDALVG